jgi:hypothetical protein
MLLVSGQKMDVWTEDGRMDRQIDGWTDRQTYELRDRQTDRQTSKQMDRQGDITQTNEQKKDGWADRWTDG